MASISAKITTFFLKRAMSGLNPPNYSEKIFKYVSIEKRYRLSKKFDYYTEKCETGADIEFIKLRGSNPKKVVYLLHGGAYILPQQDTYRKYAANLINSCGDILVALLDYRVVPNVFPAALDDAVSGFDYLLSKGYSEDDIILHGDSAGGNLSLVLCLKLRDEKRKMPRAQFLLSPWADMLMSGESYKKNHQKDAFFGSSHVMTDEFKEMLIACDMFAYFGNEDRKNPYVSPVFADFTDFPETYIVAGGDEMLLDDSVTIAKRMREDGVSVDIKIVPGLFHVFPLFPYFKEAIEAQKDIFGRISSCL